MTLNVEECLNDLSLLDGMQSVFISGVHSHERNIILKYCVMNRASMCLMIPRVGDVIMSGAQPMHVPSACHAACGPLHGKAGVSVR